MDGSNMGWAMDIQQARLRPAPLYKVPMKIFRHEDSNRIGIEVGWLVGGLKGGDGGEGGERC